MRPRRIVLAFVACAHFGCATVVNGLNQDIPVSSDPPGASVLMDGQPVGTTPLTLGVRRGYLHTVTLEKEGYLAENVTVVRTMSWWFLGDVVFIFVPVPGSGLLSMLVDLLTGSIADVEPQEIGIELIEAVAPVDPDAERERQAQGPGVSEP